MTFLIFSGQLMQGVRASDRALGSYCMLHRLALALVEDFRLLPAVLACLDRFQTKRASRVKSEVPALGPLLAMLSLSPAARHSWIHLVRLPIVGAFDFLNSVPSGCSGALPKLKLPREADSVQMLQSPWPKIIQPWSPTSLLLIWLEMRL